MQLAMLTEPNTTSLLPSSLSTTNAVLTIVIDVLEGAGNRTMAANEVRLESYNVILDRPQSVMHGIAAVLIVDTLGIMNHDHL